jgi:hypothetical protein
MAAILAAPDAKRDPGRRYVHTIPEERKRHLDVAFDRLVLRRRLGWISRAYGISVRTIYNWIDLALSYDDERAQALRDLAGS